MSYWTEAQGPILSLAEQGRRRNGPIYYIWNVFVWLRHCTTADRKQELTAADYEILVGNKWDDHYKACTVLNIYICIYICICICICICMFIYIYIYIYNAIYARDNSRHRQRTIKYYGTKLWNIISGIIQPDCAISAFKQKLKIFFLSWLGSFSFLISNYMSFHFIFFCQYFLVTD